MPASTRWSWNRCVELCVSASIAVPPGLGCGSYGPLTPVAVQRWIDVYRSFSTRVAGSWASQLARFVTALPKITSGEVLFRPISVAAMTPAAPACTSGSRAISGAPEKDATDENRSGWRAAYVMAPKPPWDRPATARPLRWATVRRLASTHGSTSSMWNVSHFDGPRTVVVSTQLVNQLPPLPSKPASGMTVMTGAFAIVLSAAPSCTQSDARPLVPWNR